MGSGAEEKQRDAGAGDPSVEGRPVLQGHSMIPEARLHRELGVGRGTFHGPNPTVFTHQLSAWSIISSFH